MLTLTISKKCVLVIPDQVHAQLYNNRCVFMLPKVFSMTAATRAFAVNIFKRHVLII